VAKTPENIGSSSGCPAAKLRALEKGERKLQIRDR
jgi:hypothetical protein